MDTRKSFCGGTDTPVLDSCNVSCDFQSQILVTSPGNYLNLDWIQTQTVQTTAPNKLASQNKKSMTYSTLFQISDVQVLAQTGCSLSLSHSSKLG